jgi:hypothetical protein
MYFRKETPEGALYGYIEEVAMVTALEQYDPQIYELLKQEEARQSGSLRMIPPKTMSPARS